MFVYLDFESTGLSRWHDRITQIGAVATRSVEGIVDRFCTLVYTEKIISAKAAEITGITNQSLVGAPSTARALQRFFDWIHTQRRPDEHVTLVAYNGIGYDYPMLCCEMSRCGLDVSVQFEASGIVALLDPLLWARRSIDHTRLLRRSSGNCSFCLTDIYQALVGEPLTNAHSALADAEALQRVCVHDAFHSMRDTTGSAHCMSRDAYILMFRRQRQAVSRSTAVKTSSLFDLLKKRTRVEEAPVPGPKKICVGEPKANDE